MNTGRTLFAQIMDFVPWTSFERLVTKYGGAQESPHFESGVISSRPGRL